MRLKAITLLIATAAMLTAFPATANASTSDAGRCSVSAVLPARLALTGITTQYGVRLTSGTDCFSYVTWDVSEGLISTGATISFFAPNTSGFFTWMGGPAVVHALPRSGAYSLGTYVDPVTGAAKTYSVEEVASNSMVIKYDSRIAWDSAARRGSDVTLRASAARFSPAYAYMGRPYIAWSGALVRFQELTKSGWQTVKSVRTNSRGAATVTLRLGRHTWRAVTATTGYTWGRTTGGHSI